MKKKNIKSLKLNKKSVSKLGNINGGNLDVSDAPDDGSWYYCHSEGSGCFLRSRVFDDCPNPADSLSCWNDSCGCPSIYTCDYLC
jgi:hypothetical protein